MVQVRKKAKIEPGGTDCERKEEEKKEKIEKGS
jgi:hypothetical protein